MREIDTDHSCPTCAGCAASAPTAARCIGRPTRPRTWRRAAGSSQSCPRSFSTPGSMASAACLAGDAATGRGCSPAAGWRRRTTRAGRMAPSASSRHSRWLAPGCLSTSSPSPTRKDITAAFSAAAPRSACWRTLWPPAPGTTRSTWRGCAVGDAVRAIDRRHQQPLDRGCEGGGTGPRPPHPGRRRQGRAGAPSRATPRAGRRRAPACRISRRGTASAPARARGRCPGTGPAPASPSGSRRRCPSRATRSA